VPLLLLHACDPHAFPSGAREEVHTGGEAEPGDTGTDEKRRDPNHGFQLHTSFRLSDVARSEVTAASSLGCSGEALAHQACEIWRWQPSADTVEDLPEANVNSELHLGLLSVQQMRQLDKNRSARRYFGRALVPAQEKGEIVARPRVTRPQANGHSALCAAERRGAEPPQ
jgi:hypothetical protein